MCCFFCPNIRKWLCQVDLIKLQMIKRDDYKILPIFLVLTPLINHPEIPISNKASAIDSKTVFLLSNPQRPQSSPQLQAVQPPPEHGEEPIRQVYLRYHQKTRWRVQDLLPRSHQETVAEGERCREPWQWEDPPYRGPNINFTCRSGAPVTWLKIYRWCI